MDTRQLKFFVACAKAGSISEAARKLYSTQSTVSKAIKNMEETMGIRLFDRLPRGISLTAQGQRYTAMPARSSVIWRYWRHFHGKGRHAGFVFL